MSQKNNNELPKQAAENTLNLNPVIGIRGKDLLTSARMVLLQAVRQPLHSARHVAHFSLELKNVLLGQSELRPGDDDRRFSDPAWSQNPLYKRYMQTYLAWRKELHSWISHSDLSPQDISRGQFVINLLTEAMSPTNSLSNPAAVKRFFETGGKSLLDGLGHLAKDLVNNGGMPSQVDMDAFEVGENLATTEGAGGVPQRRAGTGSSTGRSPSRCTNARCWWCRRRSTSSTSSTCRRTRASPALLPAQRRADLHRQLAQPTKSSTRMGPDHLYRGASRRPSR